MNSNYLWVIVITAEGGESEWEWRYEYDRYGFLKIIVGGWVASSIFPILRSHGCDDRAVIIDESVAEAREAIEAAKREGYRVAIATRSGSVRPQQSWQQETFEASALGAFLIRLLEQPQALAS